MSKKTASAQRRKALSRSLTPRDAALLALTADQPTMSEAVFKRVLDSVGSAHARALALGIRHGLDASDPRFKAVEGVKEWAARNYVVHAAPSRRKR